MTRDIVDSGPGMEPSSYRQCQEKKLQKKLDKYEHLKYNQAIIVNDSKGGEENK